ncbi:MAG: LOG family protein [Hyphomicrobiaceae bacterium]
MPSNSPQMRSHSYRLPVEDTEFLLRDEMRALRFAMEYGKAELLLRDWGVRSTVVVFGSARVPSPEKAEEALRDAGSPEARAEAERRARLVRWYEEARRFGRIVSERGGALHVNGKLRDNVIATGGGPGIMEAANRGAYEVGAPSIGFNITLPAEQEPNPYSTPDLTFRFHYFAMRKMHLAMRANALAVFPGGFGTLDELFELLTLQQTHKAPRMPIILFCRDFWSKLLDLDVMVDHGTISQADLDLFDIVDDAEEAWAAMLKRGLIAHPFEPSPEME